MTDIRYIDEHEIANKRVLLRVDFDVSLNTDATIANDLRIAQNIPTIEKLLQNNNRLICVAKLGRPKEGVRDPLLSMNIVAERLREYVPQAKVTVVDDFQSADKHVFETQSPGEILLLENIRFYKGEKENDPEFAKELAALADVFVNDAFAVSHRSEASVVGVTNYLPSYGGLLLKKELSMIDAAIKNPKKPVVVILGGSKISSKISLIDRLITLADQLLIGGGMANTFLEAQGVEIGQSLTEKSELEHARALLDRAATHKTTILLPVDVTCGDVKNDQLSVVKKTDSIESDDMILDIGPETQAIWGAAIANAQTIIWNGPVGYFENAAFRRGTDFVYYAITQNTACTSILGGGDTLAAISKKEYLENITHISTGGGAMLEYIEKGTLAGLEALATNK